MEHIETTLFMSACFAAFCGAIAYRENRSTFWGVVFGFFGGLISLIVYLIIGKKK